MQLFNCLLLRNESKDTPLYTKKKILHLKVQKERTGNLNFLPTPCQLFTKNGYKIKPPCLYHQKTLFFFFNQIIFQLIARNIPGGPVLKTLPATQETWVQSLGQEDPLEKGMATHFSILAWRIPWTEKGGGLHPMGLQSVGHEQATNTFHFFHLITFFITHLNLA